MAKISFTAGRVAGFRCPPDKQQAFLWDSGSPGLGLRATPAGKPSYVFQSLFRGKDIRITIGSPVAWSIGQAQAKARELQRQLDEGIDPRKVRAEKLAADMAVKEAAQVAALTVGEVWPVYLEQGRPKRRDDWKPRYRADLIAMADPGNKPKKRGQGLTRPGPLFPLLSLALAAVSEDSLKIWFDREAVNGRHQATRALMMFRGFLRWCASRPEYRNLTDRNAGRAPAILDDLPASKSRVGALETSQVHAWWSAVSQLQNQIASAYLRALLLVGARREEMAGLKWADVDWRWRSLTLADKVGSTRTIPLGPYMAHLLAGLPRVKLPDSSDNPFVFSANSASGHIEDVRGAHEKALAVAGLGKLTFHDLRRSFNILGEAAGAPEGAIAQVSGHRPSGTAEKYKPRTVDGLRPFLERIEAYALELAGVDVPSTGEGSRLRVVISR